VDPDEGFLVVVEFVMAAPWLRLRYLRWKGR
jgi:hypothetical protein